MERPGWLFIGSALVASELHLDPDTLSDDDWAMKVRMALYIEVRRNNNKAQLLSKLFGK